MNICVRNLSSGDSKWFSFVSNQNELKNDLESFINSQDFLIIDQSESGFKLKDVNSLSNLLFLADIFREAQSKNIPIELIQKIADYYGFLLNEAIEFHKTNFIETNDNIEDFTSNYMLLLHEKPLASLPPIIRENIDWQRIYESISVNDVISFKHKSTTYFYRR